MGAQNYNVIGMMSGTSLDGVDLAHIAFSVTDGSWNYELLACETIAYSEDWLNRLQKAISYTPIELQQLNSDYTILLGGIINGFLSRNAIGNLDAVCSHGHTVLHRPKDGITLQIGNLPNLASIIGQKVVCDFRVQDVAMGGQGAPLVPIGDRFLFADYDYCLNLGGFSNVSFEDDGVRTAFDISPVNTVLNHYARILGYDYDEDGGIARYGTVDDELLTELNSLDFYRLEPPKSLGFEFVRDIVLPLIGRYDIPVEDILRTFTEHVAVQIAGALPNKSGRLLTTGGGAYHKLLIERLQVYLPNMSIEIPDRKTLEFKEALIFGLLGVLRLRGENNVLSSVTGAPADHCSGKIFEASR